MIEIPDIPPEIRIPETRPIAYAGEGWQIYRCNANGGWEFQAPQATLTDDHGDPVALHFAGPTWQADDGSTVVGRKIHEVTPDDTAIPWLLLEASSNTGGGLFSRVTHIQRLSTVGGKAPATPCDPSIPTQKVSYTAIYVFYVPK